MARETMGSNIEPSLIQRVSQGIRYAITGVGPTNFFGPSQPLPPVAQEASEGRTFDYPVGVNLRIQPRNTEANPFSMMRGLADGYDLLRIVIETRKDQIKSYDWEIVPTDEKVSAEQVAAQIKYVSDFLERPDREHTWDDWLSMLIEDLLVIDAVAIYPAYNRGGKVMALELIDAATITRKITAQGRTPMPPDPAYQQILHGIMANDLTTDDLVYMMRNPRTNRLYGFSPVEQIIMTVNIALRRQLSQLDFYTSGNVPEAIAQVPENWTPKQIAEFQVLWDSMNEGNSAAKRKMRFVPNLKDITFPKKDVLKDEYDEWLARIVCFAFSIPATNFVKQQNRATAEQAADSAKEEGLFPLMRWLQNKMNFVIATKLGTPEVKFKWKLENAIDPLKQAQIDKIYSFDTKTITPEEVRERLGMDALTPEMKEAAWPAPPAPIAPVDESAEDEKSKQKEEKPEPKETSAEDVQKMISITVNTPDIHMGDTFVKVAGAEPSPVSVTVEAAPTPNVTVEGSVTKVYTPDVNVQLGDTTVQADMRSLEKKAVSKTFKASRQADGSMLMKLDEGSSEE